MHVNHSFGASCGLLIVFGTLLHGDSNTTLTGKVTDPSNRAVPGAQILLRNLATLVDASVTTNSEGVYEISGITSRRHTGCK